MTRKFHHSITPLVFALSAILCGVVIAQTSVLDRFKQLDANGDRMLNREKRHPAPPQAGERLTPLDRHRLCLVRDEALKRLDAKGVAKLVEIGDHLRFVPHWTAAHTGELRRLIDQIETRYGLSSPKSVPADASPEATAFAVPRREWRDVRFAESPGVDAREQSLDVNAPASGEDHPIVVFFHGGGMKAGDKAHPGVTVLKPDFFISRGFVFVSSNYRLAPRHVHPAQAEDTAAALAWVHDHAAEYGGDPGKVFVIGISAGAHLAAVVATNERFLAARGKSPAIIAGAVILDIGSFDIPTLMEQAGASAPEMYRYTFRNGGNAEDWKDCSPSHHVRPGKAVPSLLLCYVEGRAHHAQEDERFAKLVRESGGDATVLSATGKTHLSIEAEIGTRSDAVTAAILRFVESCHRRTDSRAGVTNEAAGLAARRPRIRPQSGEIHKPATGHSVGPTQNSNSQAFLDLQFSKDYFPGTKHREGHLMGGVECNYIVAHGGMLYASVSTWKQQGWKEGKTTGPQVLVKKTHDAPWQVDYTFGPEYGRAECLRSVTFTTDRTGRKLAEPVTLLLATTTGLASKGIGVWSRDDKTSRWTRMPLGQAGSAWGTEIRAMIDHVDRVTGVHHVFAGATEGLIFRGAYSPDTPGGIGWDETPEYRRPDGMTVQRIPSLAEANGELYASLEMDPAKPGSGGVFRRIDGAQPRWVHFAEWSHEGAGAEVRIGHKQDRQMRGLSAVPDPAQPGHEMLLGGRTFNGHLLRMDSTRGGEMRVECDTKAYLRQAFGSPRAQVHQLAANGFLPVIHPDTRERLDLIGLWAAHPAGDGSELGNSGWYLVRHPDGTYAHGRVWTADDPVPNTDTRGGLRTVRTICQSPFLEDRGRVFYFGGFDSGLATSPEEFGYTAWIYRGTLKEKP